MTRVNCASTRPCWDRDFWRHVADNIKPTIKEHPGWNEDDKLLRSRYPTNPRYIRLGVYSRPMSFYLDMLENTGVEPGTPYYVLSTLVNKALATATPDKMLYRLLKSLTGTVEKLERDDFIAGQLLSGLERCTPPQVWEKRDLDLDLAGWIGPRKTWAASDRMREWVERWLAKKFSRWQPKMEANSQRKLTFEQFCRDPIRWATSGGGPHIHWGEDEFRTKWAWAMQCLEGGLDPYVEALKLPNIAHVALKEEPNKTRLVITTPMSSYLRQSYVLYLSGMPELNSPIYGTAELQELQRYAFTSYSSIDAKAFDHQIPLWFVKDVIRRMFLAVGQEGLLRQEMAHINRLYVELFGVKRKYAGGVLSGWRFTSMLGTIASQCLCEWIVSKGVDTKFVCQGDDVLLYSMKTIPREVVTHVAEFGLAIDDKASIPRKAGYFLRRAYGGSFSRMSPGRALRALFYANPWVERLQYATPVSLANSWLQFASRVCDEKMMVWVIHQAAKDVTRWAKWPGWTFRRWYELMTTDTGLGGLGTLDTHVNRPFIPTLREHAHNPVYIGSSWHKLYNYLVPSSSLKSSGDQRDMYKYVRMPWPEIVTPRAPAIIPNNWRATVNLTEMCHLVVTNGFSALPEVLRRSAPHWVRTQKWPQVLSWLMRPEEISSPQHLCVPQGEISLRIASRLQLCNRMLVNARQGVLARKIGLYRWLSIQARNAFVLPGSW